MGKTGCLIGRRDLRFKVRGLITLPLWLLGSDNASAGSLDSDAKVSSSLDSLSSGKDLPLSAFCCIDFSTGNIAPSKGRLEGSPVQHCSISLQHSSSK